MTDEPYFPDLRGHDDAPEAWLGGELDAAWTLAAYRRGFFPWFDREEPLTWWSTRERMVLLPGEVHVSRSLARTMRRRRFEVSFDRAFAEVVERCADKRAPGRTDTWIHPPLQKVFGELHASGLAHSVECWRDGELVGGMYGLSLGGCFFGESMFHDVTDASKVAIATLSAHLAAWDFDLIDGQVPSPHLERLGGRRMPRSTFLDVLEASLRRVDRRGTWTVEETISASPEPG